MQAVVQRHCAAFNGCSRIYAPKYQQARLGNYVMGTKDWGAPSSWMSALLPLDLCTNMDAGRQKVGGPCRSACKGG